MRKRTVRWSALAATVISLSGCGPDIPQIETTQFAASLGVDLAAMTKTANGLYYQDQITGTGTLAQEGNLVSVHYAGTLPNAELFDFNLAPDPPFSFRIGAHDVIPGFEQGVTGMRVGGRRLLVIPPALGYGGDAVGEIPKNSILVFRIDLVTVN